MKQPAPRIARPEILAVLASAYRIAGTRCTLLLALALSMGLSGCKCSSEHPVQCVSPSDCEPRPWDSTGCSEDEGHWECVVDQCVPVCEPACVEDSDCAGETWPEGASCDEADGHWECRGGVCTPVCGQPSECADGSDCSDEPWPNDAGCDEADGHWECRSDTCTPVCDPECTEASDCNDTTWPDDAGCDETDGYWDCLSSSCTARCGEPACAQDDDCIGRTWPEGASCDEADGHWECRGGVCTPVCGQPSECADGSDCSDEPWPNDAGCDEADGHWECQSGSCAAVCDTECADYKDCEGKTWPPLAQLDCREDQGHWECDAGACTAVCNAECDQDDDCRAHDWQEDCGGHWDCVQGQCNPVCDEMTCGDGTCDVPTGETTDSCPADCEQPCTVDADCVDIGDLWELPCVGRWTCDDVCVPLCDYTTCGDGACDPAAGEDGDSCAADCLDTCQWPTDCVHEKWTKICQGRHTCLLGNCQQTCDSNGCGNGTCDGRLGETSDSCFLDCLGGPCDDAVDCLGYRWYENDCTGDGGHWECAKPAGACEAVCDDVQCGDGICDALAGESATGCPSDCQEYDCDVSADCDGLTVPDGCSSWLCVRRNCSPVCP